VDGFYDPLLSFIDLAVNEGFIKEDARRIIISAPTAKELVLKLEVYMIPYSDSVANHHWFTKQGRPILTK
jgi:cytokinin riboside 5'-monophosphate phosphoribohydrolase